MRYVALALTFSGLYFYFPAQGAEQSQPSSSFYSDKKEAALGARLAMQVRRETTPLELRDVEGYVEKIGRELASRMPNDPEEWHFSLIKNRADSSTYEPISLPGGWIFIPAQLILASNSEGEFAGMLAHAMAHVALRQGVHRQTPGDIAYLATIPVVLIGAGTFGQD
jgi:predicted Zn-dependent protease